MRCLRRLRRWFMRWAGLCPECGEAIDGIPNISGCLCNDRKEPQ